MALSGAAGRGGMEISHRGDAYSSSMAGASLPTLAGMTLHTPPHDDAAEAMARPTGQRPALDDATLAFADKVFDAARAGDADSLAQWLAAGLPPDLRTAKGDSLLMLASYHGHAAAAALLLQKGADPELANLRGQTPLAGVAFKGDLAMARLLLEHGADVNGSGPDGRTPLMFAAMFNRLEIMRLFMAQGAQVGAMDAQGVTALGCALAMGAQEAAALLRQQD